LLSKLRTRIAQLCDASSPFSGEVGAGVITIVFGILEHHGWVYTEIVPNVAKKPLQAAIRGQMALDSIIHSDGWRGYDGLMDRRYKKHFHVNHGQHKFAGGNCPINGI